MPEDITYYDSYKEERDLILEYNQVELDDVKPVDLIGLKIDNYSRQQAIVKVMRMIEKGEVHHIISIDPYKLQRIKGNTELRSIYNKADLHLAAGGGLEWGTKMLRHPLKERIQTLSFMMDLVRISEIKEYTIFLVGSKPELVEMAFFNIKKSFPKIRIVGRHGGYFNQEREKSVIEAMRKSEPDIVFVGLGFPKEDKWINKIKKEFKKTVFISIGGNFDIISGEIKKAPAFFMQRGLAWFYRIITKPWRYTRLLRVFLYIMHILFRRIFRKR